MSAGDDKESSLLRDLTGLQDPRYTANFLEVAFDAVVTFDDQEQITSWNHAAEKMFGWTAKEALGKTPAELFWPMDTPLENEYKNQRQTKLKRGETLQGEATPCRRDGSSFPAQFTARATFDSEGKICGYLAVYRDLSDKVQARRKEEQLQESNQRLNQILASIQDDFYVLNQDWVFVFASRTFTSRIGMEPGDFVGNNIWEMFPKHIGGVLYQNFHIAMEKREVRRFEIPGRYTNAWYRMSVFPSEEGITVIGTDISEQKQAEDALRESEKRLQLLNESLEQKVQEKTEEVRRLAADLVIAVQRERHRISHILHDDLQQRIYAIQMQLTFIHHELGKVHETAYRDISEVEKQLSDVLEITRNLSIDLSPPILQDEGLTQAISWLAVQMRQRYGLPIEVQADGPFIMPDDELQVLLFNCVRELLFNVVKHAGATRAMVVLQWRDDGLQIEVHDNGKGFPGKLEEKQIAGEMSDEENYQLSFGLPTLRHQLSLFEGRMEIRSEPGTGTQVILTIPIEKNE
jgi:PAS domain S-box-containing protein